MRGFVSKGGKGTIEKNNWHTLKQNLDKLTLPRHLAIVMDGNGRWAKKNGLSRPKGHEAGVEKLKLIARKCGEIGIAYLTVYAFSTENWGRPQKEVGFLLKLFRETIRDYKNELIENGAKTIFIGDRKTLSPSLVKLMESIEEATKDCSNMNFNVAFNYGSRTEIITAAKGLLGDNIAEDAEITNEDFAKHLYTRGMPEVDFFIRPGGEMRLSNFLLWQSAYAELYFVDTFWPDFGEEELAKALFEFNQRQRRFGKLKGD